MKFFHGVTLCSALSMVLYSCGGSVFTTEVHTVAEPEETIEITVDRVDKDYAYSEYFAIYDSLLISSRPNSTDDIFDVADIKNDTLLGSFMHRGEGPGEYLGLNPVRRIERRGNDLIVLTYDPNKYKLLEWNITQSIAAGRDSVVELGSFETPKGFMYTDIYRIGESEFVGYTPPFGMMGGEMLPTYWILNGEINITPRSSISTFNDDGKVVAGNLESAWSLRPDNSKIVAAMGNLAQINIIDLSTNAVHSYRTENSPGEEVLQLEYPDYQYSRVACNDESIFALYFGYPVEEFRNRLGGEWLHEFGWDGTFKKKYRLPVSIKTIWMDPSSNTLYGYCEHEDAIYRLNL